MEKVVTESPARPWYREPWPWLLMAGPALVVVAGFVTLALAMSGNDGVVADDYYKQGLAINQVLKRAGHAKELQLSATASFAADSVRVVLSANAELPAAVRLGLIHPTRSGGDQFVVLESLAPAVYEGRLTRGDGERRLLVLEDVAGTWRLTGPLDRGAEAAPLRAAQ
jgi:uncharacterized protein